MEPSHRGDPPQQRSNLDNTTIKFIMGLLYFFAGLIGLVVTVGMLQGKLNPEGTATILAGIFTGLVTAFVYTKKGEDKK